MLNRGLGAFPFGLPPIQAGEPTGSGVFFDRLVSDGPQHVGERAVLSAGDSEHRRQKKRHRKQRHEDESRE